MHGRSWIIAALLILSAGLLAPVGCTDGYSVPESVPEAGPVVGEDGYGEEYDPARTGEVRGRVVWAGDRPAVPDLVARANPMFLPPWPPHEYEKTFPNPNAPAVDPATGGVGNAVVYLRRVEIAKAKPWDHRPVTVRFRDGGLSVEQGAESCGVGFVRRGDWVRFVSEEHRFHAVRGRGADFFSLTLPEPGQVRRRALARAGVVELSSAAEYFWLRKHLFVAAHPYLARTGPDGSFELTGVPEGEYDVVAWVPNWVEQGHDRNPESRCISRLFFRPPVEAEQTAAVPAGGRAEVSLTFTGDMFAE